MRFFLALFLMSLVGCGDSRVEDNRLAAIRDAEDRRDVDAPALTVTSADESPTVRERVYRALGRIQDPAGLERLLRGLDDDESTVRQSALFAIGQLGLARGAVVDATAVETLGRRVGPVEGRSLDERVAAIEALGKLAPENAEQILLSLLEDPSAAIRAETVDALFRFRFVPTWRGQSDVPPEWSDITVRSLALSLRDPDVEVRRQTAHAVSRYGEPRVVDLLGGSIAAVLQDDDTLVRLWLVRGLGRIPAPASSTVLSVLGDACGDAEPSVRVEAMAALARLGEAAAIPVGLAGDTSFHVRRGWANAAAGAGQESVLPALTGLLLDPSAEVRAAAVASLIQHSETTPPAEWETWIADPTWQVRAAAAAAAGSWESDRVQHLESVLADPETRVRTAALSALSGLDGIMPHIVRALNDDDLAIRATGVTLLTSIENEQRVELLGDVLRRSPGDDWVEVREAVIAALATSDDPAAAVILRDAASNDTASSVRAASAGALRRLGVEPPTPSGSLETATPSPWIGQTFRSPPRVRLETDRGVIEMQTLPDAAPIHVAHFVELVERGFYDGLIWHRVVSNFVVQGGDPRGDGWGSPGYSLRDEISRVRFRRGTVGMPKAGKDTGGCQLFITHVPTPHLDGNYTIFAQVDVGMEVVDRLQVGDRIRRARVSDGPRGPRR
ncbi:MAG: HEAT repeat domain-containing protein [Acidobacteriota bacterium]|nr:HEAT repeat domain-containing protein [Acidobacteriota bacterium]